MTSLTFITLLVSTAFCLWLAEDIMPRSRELLRYQGFARGMYMMGGLDLIWLGFSALR